MCYSRSCRTGMFSIAVTCVLVCVWLFGGRINGLWCGHELTCVHVVLQYVTRALYCNVFILLPIECDFAVFDPGPEPSDPQYWIIGAVLGGLVFLAASVWLILFIYFRCTRRPPATTPRGSMTSKSPKSARKVDPDDVVTANGKKHSSGVRCIAVCCTRDAYFTIIVLSFRLMYTYSIVARMRLHWLLCVLLRSDA